MIDNLDFKPFSLVAFKVIKEIRKIQIQKKFGYYHILLFNMSTSPLKI